MAQHLGSVLFSYGAVPCRLSGLSKVYFPDTAAFSTSDLRLGAGLERAGIALVAALPALGHHPNCRENAGSQKAHPERNRFSESENGVATNAFKSSSAP